MDEPIKKRRINKDCIMEEKIDRLENHFKVYKSDVLDISHTVKNIEVALLGSNYNDKKGIVYLLDSLDKRVQTLEDKQILADDRIDTLKWFQRGVIGVIFAYITWLITK